MTRKTTVLALTIGLCITIAGREGRAADESWLNNGVTAHRGNSGVLPENTLPAFQSGIEVGADWLELDVYRTIDGEVVVIHDPDTRRVAEADLKVAKSTYAQLKALDVAYQFRKANKLSLQQCPQGFYPPSGRCVASGSVAKQNPGVDPTQNGLRGGCRSRHQEDERTEVGGVQRRLAALHDASVKVIAHGDYLLGPLP